MVRKLLIGFLTVGAISMFIMSTHYFQSASSGILRTKEVATSLWYIIIFRIHVFFGILAIAVGPIQFLKRIRSRYNNVHKCLGYVYVISVALSSISGLVIAQYAMGGLISTAGFSVLSITWFYVTLKSILSIGQNKPKAHRMWAFLSYSLTFAAITQRTFLLIPLFTDIPFISIYRLSAWFPWVLNLSFAFLLVNKSVLSTTKTVE